MAAHPASARLAAEASASLLGGVPMTWMAKWPGPFPVFLEARARRAARGRRRARLRRPLPGRHRGDGGPQPAAGRRRGDGAPDDAAAPRRCSRPRTPRRVGGVLADRFGLPTWSFALSATDANRWVLRLARHLTRRPQVLVFDGCYHGTVDETFAVLRDGARRRPGTATSAPGRRRDHHPRVRVQRPRRRRARARPRRRRLRAHRAGADEHRDRPARAGVPGRARAACRRAGTLLVIDETHTLSAGYGGCTRAWGLRPGRRHDRQGDRRRRCRSAPSG